MATSTRDNLVSEASGRVEGSTIETWKEKVFATGGTAHLWTVPEVEPRPWPEHLDSSFDRLDLVYEEAEAILWCWHGDRSRPCYTPELLAELRRLFAMLATYRPSLQGGELPFDYLIWGSRTRGIWNLGGDLELFVRLIEARDVDRLRDYAYACVDTVYQNYMKCELPYLTIALVQGDALGGGFEAVLSNDVIIAEEHAHFGLPEIMFNMFPGMGAYSFLSRRLNATQARSMILSGRLYSASELAELGLIDMVVPTGEGEAGLRSFVDRNRGRRRALKSLSMVGRCCDPVDRTELVDVADLWVENAMGVTSSDLRRMRRLVRAQMRRHERAGPS